MILRVYSVKDQKTDQFGTPMFLMADGQAIRSFGDEVNRSVQDNQLYMHPDDFDLYFFGLWESDTGLFTCSTPSRIASGAQLKVRS